MSTPIAAAGGDTVGLKTKRNVAVLAFAHAVLGAQLALNIIVAGLAGALLADDPSLATLPLSIVVLGSLITTPGVSSSWAVTGAALVSSSALRPAPWARLVRASLVHRQLRAFSAGIGAARNLPGSAGFFRFAAADSAPDAFKARRSRGCLPGGLLSALLVRKSYAPHRGLSRPCRTPARTSQLSVLNVVVAVVLAFLDIPVPEPSRPPRVRAGRSPSSCSAGVRRRGPVGDGGLCVDDLVMSRRRLRWWATASRPITPPM